MGEGGAYTFLGTAFIMFLHQSDEVDPFFPSYSLVNTYIN